MVGLLFNLPGLIVFRFKAVSIPVCEGEGQRGLGTSLLQQQRSWTHSDQTVHYGEECMGTPCCLFRKQLACTWAGGADKRRR